MFFRHKLSTRFYVFFAQSGFLIMHIYEHFNHIFTIISSNCLYFYVTVADYMKLCMASFPLK